MHSTLTLPTLLLTALTATTSAFVLDTYSDTNCGGSVQTGVNVWDNTCATWPDGFKSYKITVWGGSHQYAYFFAPDNCGSLPGAIGQGYVDSTTNNYVLNTCYSFSGGVANAIASYAG